MIMNYIKKLKEFFRTRRIRRTVAKIRKEAAKQNVNFQIVENYEISEKDYVIDGPDGSKLIISGLTKEDKFNIKDLMKGMVNENG